MKYLAFFLSSILCFSSYAIDIKIGFIDTNIVITNLSKYRQSIEVISKEFEPKKQELLDLYNHIVLVRSNIHLIQKTKSSDSIESEILKLSNLEKSFKNETELWQNAMNVKKLDLLNEIELIVNRTINEYAKRENYDLIFYENIAFVSDEINITQEIIAEIEKL